MKSEQPTVITRCSNESTGTWTNPEFFTDDKFQIDWFREGRVRWIKKHKWICIDGKVSMLWTVFHVSTKNIQVTALIWQNSHF